MTAFTPGAARGPRSANPDTAGNRLPGTPSEPGDPSRADAVEELLERARLERNAKGPELRVVLNDDRLGRVAVHAAGRNGWVNASVRTDSPQTARLIEQTSAEVAESLARKGFVAEAHGATSEGAYREQEQERERRRSMANSPMRTRYRTRGSGQDFAASLNALPR